MFARLQILCCLFCYLSIGTAVAKLYLRRANENQSPYQNEPAYGNQSWIFEMINLLEAWNMGYTGEKIRVRINDDNWEHNHTEWKGRKHFVKNNNNAEDDYSCGDSNNILTNNTHQNGGENTTLTTASLNHGAAVTSIIAADGTNDFCGTGIAPQSKLSFCNFREGSTNATVLMHTALPVKLSADISYNTAAYDISINAFAYEGCGLEPLSGHTGPRKKRRSRFLRPKERYEGCPFLKFYNDSNNIGDDPCMVCKKADFEFLDASNKRDNVFAIRDNELQTASTSTSAAGDGGSDHKGISEPCAASVKIWCLRNFRKDETLCTEWIDVINIGNACNFKSNVGRETNYALERGAKEGRNGRGVVYIFASGDSYGKGDNVNYQAYPKSRFVMTVGAVKVTEVSDGNETTTLQPIHSTYSTSGSSVFVVAPGGDYDSSYGHVGAGGIGGFGTSCVNIGYGTAFAAPVVGGVVALVLEAYEKATWRDVRAIIAETSKPVEILDDENNNDDATFGINAAGVGYSDLYGFGLIDATKAVKEAEMWKTQKRHLPSELGITARSGIVNLDIYDDSYSTTTSTITLYDNQYHDATLESVSVYLKLRYFNRGHLRITVRSPSGTTSLLSPGGRHEYGQLECGEWWEFLTLRTWGENPNGVWKLSITDTKRGDGDVQCVDLPGFLVPSDVIKQMDIPRTCEEFESKGFCSDGKINEDNAYLKNEALKVVLFEESYGTCDMTAVDACCACGGGIRPDDGEVLYNQLEEWKIVLGDGTPRTDTFGTVQQVSFYDEPSLISDENKTIILGFDDYNETFDLEFDGNEAIAGDEGLYIDMDDEIVIDEPKAVDSLSPTEGPLLPPPTPPPTWRPIIKMPDNTKKTEPTAPADEEVGVFGKIKNFLSGLVGGNNDDDAGESNTRTVSTIAWIITFGFSILLIMRGSSFINFNVNFLRESTFRRQLRQTRGRERRKKRGREKRGREKRGREKRNRL